MPAWAVRPFYMTFTGGEPFLRNDLDDLVISAYRHCKPEVITIPTNGMLTERVLAMRSSACAASARQSSIGINLSLDGIGDEHDDIRGVEGNWKLSMETWRQLKELQKQHKNLGADGAYGDQPLQRSSLQGDLRGVEVS